MLDSPEYNDFVEKSKEYNLIPVYQEIRADLETPLSIYIKLSDNKYSFLLESITGGENLARYSIIGTNPRKVIKTGKNQVNQKSIQGCESYLSNCLIDPFVEYL